MIDESIEVFFDGHCPLCRREMGWIRRRDRRHRIRFTDIAAPGFDASTTGVAWPTLMDRIHARLLDGGMPNGRMPNGRIVEGVEVFRRIYAALGFGPLVALTRLPGVRQLLDLAYRWFARNRLRLTGRCKDDACRLCPQPTQPRHRTDGARPPS